MQIQKYSGKVYAYVYAQNSHFKCDACFSSHTKAAKAKHFVTSGNTKIVFGHMCPNVKLVGKHGHFLLQAKKEENLPACYKSSISNDMGLHTVWAACMFWKAMNAESYIKVFTTYAPPPDNICLREDFVYFRMTMQNYTLQLKQHHSFVADEPRC